MVRVTPLALAIRVPTAVEVTGVDVATKDCSFAPEPTLTEVGVERTLSVSLSETVTPPGGANLVKATEPFADVPPLNVEGVSDTDSNAAKLVMVMTVARLAPR